MTTRESRPGNGTAPQDPLAADHLHPNGNGRFRGQLKAIADELGMRYTDLKATGRDPFKLDTPANHRDAQWLKA